MKIAIISANFNKFDSHKEWEVPMEIDVFRVNEDIIPVRKYAMTGRLQSKLLKEFGWQIYPGYDIYMWIDASFKLLPGATEWLLSGLGDKDLALFKHPFNNTIKEEYEFLKSNMNKEYVRKRYETEFLEEQYKVITDDKSYIDDSLYCGGIIIYKNDVKVFNMLKEWWYHTTRYHMDDQLSLPYVLRKSGCSFNVFKENIYKLPLIPHISHNIK